MSDHLIDNHVRGIEVGDLPIMREGIVTFDLDSTLADTEHRFGLIDREGGTDWHAYAAACVDDEPIEAMLLVVRLIHMAGVECHALSGRKSTALEQTRQWFAKHDVPIEHIWLDESEQGDYTHEKQHVDYKLARLREIERITGKRVILHVDDWAGVAHHFNEVGIPTVCVRAPFEIREMIEKDEQEIR